MNPALEQAVAFARYQSPSPPPAGDVVADLLAAEKQRKQLKHSYELAQLVGCWRLSFITGTQGSRQRMGQWLGAGRFLPRWLPIHLTYTLSESAREIESAPPQTEPGRVRNRVTLGLLQLTVTGPTLFYPRTPILAFDFTHLKLTIAGKTIYDGYISDGEKRELAFLQKPLKEQAFFVYFWVQENAIAARGRGGGLALWVRDNP